MNWLITVNNLQCFIAECYPELLGQKKKDLTQHFFENCQFVNDLINKFYLGDSGATDLALLHQHWAAAPEKKIKMVH